MIETCGRGAEESGAELVDLGRGRFASGEDPEVDQQLESRRLPDVRDEGDGKVDHA